MGMCSLLRILTDDPESITTWTGTCATLTVISGVFFEGIIVYMNSSSVSLCCSEIPRTSLRS